MLVPSSAPGKVSLLKKICPLAATAARASSTSRASCRAPAREGAHEGTRYISDVLAKTSTELHQKPGGAPVMEDGDDQKGLEKWPEEVFSDNRMFKDARPSLL